MLRSTSALTPPVRMEVDVLLYREDTNAFVVMDTTAKTANIQDMLAILILAKMEDTAESQKSEAMYATVHLAYQESTAKLTP